MQRPLLLICINCSGDDCLWGCGDLDRSDSLECREALQVCGIGSEPFFSPLSFYQAHMLIFTIAFTHILYTALSMTLCTWKIGRWRKYENEALNTDDWRLSSKHLLTDYDASNDKLKKWTYTVFGTIFWSINQNIYIGLRRLFIERFDLDDDFNFHSFVVGSMEEEYAEILSLEFISWLIVVLYVALPKRTYSQVWLTGIAAIAIFACAVKIQDILNKLALDAYRRWGGRSRRYNLNAMNFRLSSSGLPSPGESLVMREDAEIDDVINEEMAASDGGGGGGPCKEVNKAAAALKASNGGVKGAELEDVVVVAADTHSNNNKTEQTPPTTVQSRKESSRKQPQRKKKGRFVSWISTKWPFTLWKQEKQRLELARGKSFSRQYRGLDAANLFWFGQPKLVMRTIQFSYFLNSMSIAVFIFSVWNEVIFDFRMYGGWAVEIPMLCLAVGIALFISLRAAPSYALVSVVGSHTQESLVELALKKNVHPNIARELQRISPYLGAANHLQDANGGAFSNSGSLLSADSSLQYISQVNSGDYPEHPVDGFGSLIMPPGDYNIPGKYRNGAAALGQQQQQQQQGIEQQPKVPAITGRPSLARKSADVVKSALHEVGEALKTDDVQSAQDYYEENEKSLPKLLGAMYASKLRRISGGGQVNLSRAGSATGADLLPAGGGGSLDNVATVASTSSNTVASGSKHIVLNSDKHANLDHVSSLFAAQASVAPPQESPDIQAGGHVETVELKEDERSSREPSFNLKRMFSFGMAKKSKPAE